MPPLLGKWRYFLEIAKQGILFTRSVDAAVYLAVRPILNGSKLASMGAASERQGALSRTPIGSPDRRAG
jgi:hypothetical protein